MINRNLEIKRLYEQGCAMSKLAEFFDISSERIRQIVLGETKMHRMASNKSLSKRELEILELVAEGLTDSDIAFKLTISPRTVQTHVKRISAKLVALNRTNAVYIAIKQGLF